MKRGKAVRVKPAAEGCGFAIIVHHGNGKKHALAIRKGKGHQLQLNGEELQLNKDNVHHLHGKGIYEQVVKAGKAIVAGTKSAAKALYSGASYAAKNFEPAVMAGAEYGVDAGLAALAEAYPQYKEVIMKLKPLGKAAAKQGIKYIGSHPLKDEQAQKREEAKQYVEDLWANPKKAPSSGRFGAKPKETNVGGTKAPYAPSLKDLAQHADLINEIGKATGSELASRTMSGIANTLANQQDALNTDMEVSKRKVANVAKGRFAKTTNADEGSQGHGLGLYGGGGLGLYAGSSRGGSLRHHSSKHAIVGTHGGFMSGGSMNPALLSQPFSSHFAWKNRLPPAYQRYIV